MKYQERYQPQLIDVDGTYVGTYDSIGGFLCKTGGLLTVTRADSVVIVDEMPVTAGIWYPLPFFVGKGATITLASGASGTLGV
jgi:hypothetical protein